MSPGTGSTGRDSRGLPGGRCGSGACPGRSGRRRWSASLPGSRSPRSRSGRGGARSPGRRPPLRRVSRACGRPLPGGGCAPSRNVSPARRARTRARPMLRPALLEVELDVVDVGELDEEALGAGAVVLEVDLLEAFGGDGAQLGLVGPGLLGGEEAGGVLRGRCWVMRRIRPSSVVPGAALKPKRARVSMTRPVCLAALARARLRTRAASGGVPRARGGWRAPVWAA